jgi:hypothetical protein
MIILRKLCRSIIARQACRAMADHAVTAGSDRGTIGIVKARANGTRPCRGPKLMRW